MGCADVTNAMPRPGLGFPTRVVLMCQWFAPTKFVITTEGMDESVFVKDRGGKVVGMKFPEKLVLVTNHQVCGV